MFTENNKKIKICKNCGCHFTHGPKFQKFCSTECFHEYPKKIVINTYETFYISDSNKDIRYLKNTINGISSFFKEKFDKRSHIWKTEFINEKTWERKKKKGIKYTKKEVTKFKKIYYV